MSSNTPVQPRAVREGKSPTRTRTFQDGKVDPIITNKRPLLTIGNGVLLFVGVGYGMYATGHLPQLDAFFNHMDDVGKAHNSTVVNALITYGSFLFGGVLLVLFGLMIFAFVNAHRRRESDPSGWEKTANQPPQRTKAERRVAEDLPSMIMPIGKERPNRRAAETPAAGKAPAAVAAEAIPSTAPANTPLPALLSVAPVVGAPVVGAPVVGEAAMPSPSAPVAAAQAAPVATSPAKLAAMKAAAKAEAAADSAPPDLPSFVQPFGKRPKPATKMMKTAEVPAVAPAEIPLVKEASAPTVLLSSTAQAEAQTVALNAKAEAAIASARAATLKAEAAVATARAEAAVAIAKAEAAVAEATIAAAKAEALQV
jgi:hypothetical protein